MRARRERQRAIEAIPALAGMVAAGRVRWCDSDESDKVATACAKSGRAADRVIQRWTSARVLEDALVPAVATSALETECYELLLDYSDAGWAVGPRAEMILILLAGLERMTDGFALFDAEAASVFSVDVESLGDATWVETTVVGPAFSQLTDELVARGPAPLPVISQDRPLQ
jgi:hypothetical protein